MAAYDFGCDNNMGCGPIGCDDKAGSGLVGCGPVGCDDKGGSGLVGCDDKAGDPVGCDDDNVGCGPVDCDDAGGKIHIKASEKGSLHRALGVPQGQKIPASKLAAAKRSKDPAIRKKANFAANASHWHHDNTLDAVRPWGYSVSDSAPDDDAEVFFRELASTGSTQSHYGEMRPAPKR